MKITLIKPPTCDKAFPGDELYIEEPLELEYVAAGVSDNHDVTILDMRFDRSLEEHLEEFTPAVVGLTCFTPQVYIVKDLCKKIKAFDPGILTVVGGYHATLSPHDFCDPAIDIIVRGEGVFTFRELVERHEKKQDVYSVKGISFYHNNELKSTEPRFYPNLDSFPFPDRSLTEHHREKYFFGTLTRPFKPIATIRTSKGCPFRCKFCGQWKVTNKRYLTREPESIFEELKTIKEPYVDFADDETFINVDRMSKLADLIIDSGIKKRFYTFARSDTVVNNPGLFEKWKKAGMERVLIGLESFHASDLEYFRKQTTVGNNEKAVSIMKKIGVQVDASFIIFPDYDTEDFDNFANYASTLDADMVMCLPLTPLPGTDLYDELKDQVTTTNLELYDITHMVLPTKLPLEKFYREFTYLLWRINKKRINFEALDASDVQRLMKFPKAFRNHYSHHQAT